MQVMQVIQVIQIIQVIQANREMRVLPLMKEMRRILVMQVTDMEFFQDFTPPDFQAKNLTPSISPNFNSFSGKKHKQ